jgi:hypothetical protein
VAAALGILPAVVSLAALLARSQLPDDDRVTTIADVPRGPAPARSTRLADDGSGISSSDRVPKNGDDLNW